MIQKSLRHWPSRHEAGIQSLLPTSVRSAHMPGLRTQSRRRETRNSNIMKEIRNLRDKHVAHYLAEKAEQTENSSASMKHGDEGPVIETAIAIVETLNSYVNDVSLSFEDCRAIDQKCATALWNACTFTIAT